VGKVTNTDGVGHMQWISVEGVNRIHVVHLPSDMRPVFSMDSLMALGMDTREVLPLRIFFFFGLSTSVYRGVERDRCLRW
jgi:hypothetical protein